MRLSNLALAALAALGVPLAAHAQLVAPAKSPKASLAGCAWTEIGRFPNLAPRGVAAGPDGSLFLAADDLTDAAHPMLVVLRQSAPGAAWEGVDRYRPTGVDSSGARALHVDADGNVFVLGWKTENDRQQLFLRRSLNGGLAGTWESGDETWPATPGGALGSDGSGRIYVAYGFADSGGIGWRVESALRGIGAFAPEDEVTFSGPFGAAPQDFERKADGTLVVAGQLDGNPDEWVVRSRPTPRGNAAGVWRTIDRFELAPNSYGLAPRAIVATSDGRLLVAGLGVRGGGQDDYQWLERWQNARGKWKTVAYQLATGFNSFAQDAAATAAGVAVLGVGYTAAGATLVLRESSDGGSHWQNALQLAGITDPWTARLAVSAKSAAVAASLPGAAVVLGCNR
ncbi:MAG TPA: hypothetical protein VGS57_23490 [Thermoanaerobaculia bacterium]|nr:hypothetical protein [Thermoanaerobaculia bacterium]